MTLRKTFTLIASYFGFIAALTLAVCLAFGTKIREEREHQAVQKKSYPKSPLEIKDNSKILPLKPKSDLLTSVPQKSKEEVTSTIKKTEKPEPIPPKRSALKKPTGSSLKFTLEVKVYRDFEAAESLRMELAKNKIRAYIVPTTVENDTFYRVRVGKFKTEAKAIETSKMFHKVTQIPTRIVKM